MVLATMQRDDTHLPAATARQTGARPLPLSGVRVLDFSQAMQGPYASFLLAMAGADVIKVESLQGEMVRSAGKASAYLFEILNNSKRSIAVDLKHPEGRDAILALIPHMDIVLENFSPGVMDRLGLNAETLLDHNPRLVYASGSGYGANSARRNDVAMDSTIQAMSGLIYSTGDPDGPPMRAGMPVADIMSGIHLYAATVTALFDARVTGIGRVTEVSMLEAMFPLQLTNLNTWYVGGQQQPERYGNRHPLVSPQNVYATQSGWLQVMCGTNGQWVALGALLGPEFADDQSLMTVQGRIDARDRIDQAVARWLAGKDRMEVLRTLLDARIPAAPVMNTLDILADEDLRRRGFLHDVDHPALGAVPMPGSALRFEGSEGLTPGMAKGLGADTEQIFGGLAGMATETLAKLRAAGAIK